MEGTDYKMDEWALKGFPPEIVEKMLDRQEQQGNGRDIEVFEGMITSPKSVGGFNWLDTPEGYNFWNSVIKGRRFNIFWDRYPTKTVAEGPVQTGSLSEFESTVKEVEILCAILDIHNLYPQPQCYLVALLLASQFQGVIHYNSEHCVTQIDGHLYDKRGRISGPEGNLKDGNYELLDHFGHKVKRRLVQAIFEKHGKLLSELG